MKTAFLVDFNPRTRVVVEVPDNFSIDKSWEKMTEEEHDAYDYIIQRAREQILMSAEEYLTGDNLSQIEEDTECPFGTFDEDLDNA